MGMRVADTNGMMEDSSRMWILVAHESGARIFSRKDRHSPLLLVEAIDHPIGRAKNREILSEHGGSDQSWIGSKQRHGVGDKVDPVSKNAENFAKALAEKLNKGRDEDRFDNLLLVAGPKFLGMLRSELPVPTARRVVGTVGQNLGGFSEREIPEHIGSVLKDFDSRKTA
jgi:protein required for attachment to host cells